MTLCCCLFIVVRKLVKSHRIRVYPSRQEKSVTYVLTEPPFFLSPPVTIVTPWQSSTNTPKCQELIPAPSNSSALDSRQFSETTNFQRRHGKLSRASSVESRELAMPSQAFSAFQLFAHTLSLAPTPRFRWSGSEVAESRWLRKKFSSFDFRRVKSCLFSKR